LNEAILNKTEWWQTMAMLAAQLGMMGMEGMGVVMKADLDAAKQAAPAILSKIESAGSMEQGLKSLTPMEQRQLLAAISDAEQAKAMGKSLTPEQQALFDTGTQLGVEARAGGESKLVALGGDKPGGSAGVEPTGEPVKPTGEPAPKPGGDMAE